MGRSMVTIDIGGTFTDLVSYDVDAGNVHIEKVSSTPKDYAQGVVDGLRRLADDYALDLSGIFILTHGTTVATNAIIQRKGAKTGALVTKGFRDIFEFARRNRLTLYDLHWTPTEPLIPRSLVLEMDERVTHDGSVLESLDERKAKRTIRKLLKQGVDSIAVSLLFSYANPSHERKIGELIREESRGIHISLSSEINPQYREYERASTTAANAYVMPVMDSYISSLERSFRDLGISASLYLMQASGGVTSTDVVRTAPVSVIESGPTAGALAAAYVAKAAGYEDAISFDMGGTTAKACLVEDGEPARTSEYNIGGHPIRVPALDVVEVGSGGGSIAWLDPGRVLHVGPQSAGADPGPACYGLSGTDPTITDANLYLGRLNPDYFLGGEMKVFPGLAEEAIRTKITTPMGIDPARAAFGMIELACNNMIDAIRLVTVEKGIDPRDYTLVAYGGAGPLHAARLAEELEIPMILIPPSPGTHSAWGLITTDILHPYIQTCVTRAEGVDFERIEGIFGDLEEKGRSKLKGEGIIEGRMRFVRQVDIRYLGQWHEVTMPLLEGRLDEDSLPRLVRRFHDLHDRRFAWKSEETPTEIVNLRVDAIGVLPKFSLKPAVKKTGSLAEAVSGSRKVWLNEHGGFSDCTIYRRDLLPTGSEFEGPAITEEKTSTTFVPSGRVHVDGFDNIIVEMR